MDENISKELPGVETLVQSIADLPDHNFTAIVIGVLLWLVGGNIVGYLSLKRRGIPFWQVMVPDLNAFKAVFGMNIIEWLIIIALAVISLSLIYWGCTGDLPPLLVENSIRGLQYK